jgi:hypothetical protein
MASKRLLTAFGLLVITLLATSRPERVGDAREYLAMAMNLADLGPPALSQADIARVEIQCDQLHLAGMPLTTPSLRGPDGRQDFFHFWFYSALAVPGIWMARVAGLNPNLGFVALNASLLMGAFWIVSRRTAWWVVAVTFCSPVLWWVNKTHTEVFTFSLLAVAGVVMRDAPWWAMVCLGAAATQNPPIASLVALVGGTAPLWRRGVWRDARFWIGTATATALTVIHPLYYLSRLGVPNPQLLGGVDPRVPTLKELGAVVWDPNIGLLFHAPLFVLTLLAAAVVLAGRPRVWVRSPEVWLAAAGAGVFVAAFAQTPNVNHGGTPGISRYALWLIPLALPAFQRAADAALLASHSWFLPLVSASCLWCVINFHPGMPESYRTPTRAARVIWERWPWLDDPLPEVFSERVSGEEPGLVPAATADCSKVLLAAGTWPVPCFPQPPPWACRSRDSLCYANRADGRYSFVPLAPRASYVFDRQRQRTWAWSEDPEAAVQKALAGLHWPVLQRVSQSAPGAAVRATWNVSWTYGLQSDAELLVYMARPRRDASVTLRLPGTMAGSLFDPEAGHEIQAVRIETRPWDLKVLPVPPGRAVVLVLTLVR